MESGEWKRLFWIALAFAVFYFVPSGSSWFTASVLSGISLLREYAREHVLTCLLPALFIAGAIAVFLRKDKILKYLGGDAKRYLSYSIASVSGSVLAVCSCTILPLFAGIRKRGAGLGPAITFLFSGPAINIAAVFLTFSVLGARMGAARITAAVLLSILVGLTMSAFFREKAEKGPLLIQENPVSAPAWAIASLFALMLGILVVNGLGIPYKGIIIALIAVAASALAAKAFSKDVSKAWLAETWNFSRLILPLLFIGVFAAGFLMPLVPEGIVYSLVGQNTPAGNLAASVFGAFMYFSTLTEVPILQALIEKGMHPGPALALLLAGPSLSLPNMLVIRGVLGTKKTIIYIGLVIAYSAAAGLIFGGII